MTRRSDPNPAYWEQYGPFQHVKHELIRCYLNGWFPKLGTWAGRVLYVDTHAGRGRYESGDPGLRWRASLSRCTKRVVGFPSRSRASETHLARAGEWIHAADHGRRGDLRSRQHEGAEGESQPPDPASRVRRVLPAARATKFSNVSTKRARARSPRIAVNFRSCSRTAG